jgi:hypothetical protein
MLILKSIKIDEGVSVVFIEEVVSQQSDDMESILDVIDLTEEFYQVLEVMAS